MKGYRIVEIKNGKALSLFHGTKGSRVLPVGKWLKADIKEVQDGSGKKKRYRSGFHFFKTLKETQEFFEKTFRIKTNRTIVPCEVRGVRPKHHSKSNILLADEIKILELVLDND